MAGTSGNVAWAEDGTNPVTEPVDGAKAGGFAFQDPWAAENANWQLQRLGRAALRRFDTATELIAARRSGTGPPEEPEDIGVVKVPNETSPPARQVWGNAATAGVLDLCSDGEYLWLTSATGGHLLDQHDRDTGAWMQSGPGAGGGAVSWAQLVATCGSNVYMLFSDGVTWFVGAYNRATLVYEYSIDTTIAVATTAQFITTDGEYVLVGLGNSIYLYQDTGAALIAGGTWAHAAAVAHARMDGYRIVVGGANDPAGPPFNQITLLDYTLTPLVQIQRTVIGVADNAVVNRVDWDGERIVFAGAADGGGATCGLFESRYATQERWRSSGIAGNITDIKFVRGRLSSGRKDHVVGTDNTNSWIVTFHPETGVVVHQEAYELGVGAGQPARLFWDGESLFCRGSVTAAGYRLKRYLIHDTPQAYGVQLPTVGGSGRVYRPIQSVLRQLW